MRRCWRVPTRSRARAASGSSRCWGSLCPASRGWWGMSSGTAVARWAGLAETLLVFGLEAGALWMAGGDGKLTVVATKGLERHERERVAVLESGESEVVALALSSPTPVQMRFKPRIRRFGSEVSAVAV